MKTEVVPYKKQDTKKDEKDKTPAKTGDNTQLVVFAALFLVSGIYLLMRMSVMIFCFFLPSKLFYSLISYL